MVDLIAMFFCGFFCACALMAIVIVSIMFKEDAPAADVRPVVHGEWKPVRSYKYNALVGWTCSVCGYEIDVSEDGFNYCPKCGADLRECDT